MTPEQVARAFVGAINRQSVEDLAALMTEDHVFIDSLGARIEGREPMTPAWAGYFRMVPDYRVTIDETFGSGDIVLLTGTAQGSYAGQPWKTAAAFRAVVRDDRIAEWRIYADNEPIRKLMRESAQ